MGDETGFAVFDPLGLADLGSPATLSFFRHAELKHCRVSMAAFLGWLVATGNQLAVSKGGEGIHFPGLCSFSGGVSFADIAAAGGPMEQWAAVPAEGKFQILLAIGIIEHQSEWKVRVTALTRAHSPRARETLSTAKPPPPPPPCTAPPHNLRRFAPLPLSPCQGGCCA